MNAVVTSLSNGPMSKRVVAQIDFDELVIFGRHEVPTDVSQWPFAAITRCKTAPMVGTVLVVWDSSVSPDSVLRGLASQPITNAGANLRAHIIGNDDILPGFRISVCVVQQLGLEILCEESLRIYSSGTNQLAWVDGKTPATGQGILGVAGEEHVAPESCSLAHVAFCELLASVAGVGPFASLLHLGDALGASNTTIPRDVVCDRAEQVLLTPLAVEVLRER